MSDAVSADPRLVLSEPELDAALDAAAAERPRLGRGHWRMAFLLRRRPGLGVRALADLTGLSKQGASRTLADLVRAGLVETSQAEDARRRPASLTPAGLAFEALVGERLRASLARAYRAGGIEHAPSARRVWSALAGARASARPRPALP